MNIHEQKRNNSSQQEQEITELVDIIDQNIEDIVALHMHAEGETSHQQRLIERITANLGRPRFFYLIVCFVAFWLTVNILAPHLGLRPFDPPPFSWLQDIVSMSALLMTTVIVITQNRQATLTDQRRHLDLQVNLLVERKVTKLIDLLDELRHDMPIVEDKRDPQAEAMKETVDPHKVLQSLHETLKESTIEQ